MPRPDYLPCYSNLVWLHRGGVPGTVLCVAPDPSGPSAALRRWSERVKEVAEGECGARLDEIVADGPFDSVLLLSDRAPQLQTAMARALGPNGRMYVVVPRRRAAAVRAAGRRAHLRIHHRYSVAPSIHRPFLVVPDDPATVAGSLSIRAPLDGVRAVVRRAGLSLGLRPSDMEGAVLVLGTR